MLCSTCLEFTDLVRRIESAIATLPDPNAWAVAASGGRGLQDRHFLSLYASASPKIPDRGGPQPIVDALPDFYLLNVEFAQHALDSMIIRNVEADGQESLV